MMTEISFKAFVAFITGCWLIVRAAVWLRQGRIDLRREARLLLVLLCLFVVARFTFFPFSRLNGRVQPLLFDSGRVLPFRINPVPLIKLFDYEIFSEAVLNFVGNTAMFIPVGFIWPFVFRELDSPAKAMAAGVLFSLCIELLQLPFFDRVTDIDDLILNSLGYAAGCGVYFIIYKNRTIRQQVGEGHEKS